MFKWIRSLWRSSAPPVRPRERDANGLLKHFDHLEGDGAPLLEYVLVGGILGLVLDGIAGPAVDGLLFTLGGATAGMVLYFIQFPRRKDKGKDG